MAKLWTNGNQKTNVLTRRAVIKTTAHQKLFFKVRKTKRGSYLDPELYMFVKIF